MNDLLRGRASASTPADRRVDWVRDYTLGKYTDVVRDWLAARANAVPAGWVSDDSVVEAVGWSLALTKSWAAYELFHHDLSAADAGSRWLAMFDAWRAVHEGRYDAAAHAARSTRADLMAPGSQARLTAFTLKVEGVALLRLGRYVAAETLTRRALELFEVAAEPLQVAQCATNLGLILNARGDHRAARVELQRALAALESSGAAEERQALGRENLAIVELHLGNVDNARGLYESALRTFQALGLASEQITARNGLGHCARVQGHFDAALGHYRAALHLGSPQLTRQVCLCHEFIGRTLFERGERPAAESHYRRALEIAAHIAPEGDLMLEVSWHYAELLVAERRFEAAHELLERAEALCESSGERRELGCVQRVRARWLAAQGDASAHAVFEAALDTLHDTGRTFESFLTLVAHAEGCVALRDHTRACELLSAARTAVAHTFPGSLWIDRVETLLAMHAPAAGGSDPAVRYGIWTRDRELLALLDDLPAIAATPYPVLVDGESGTGKELLARAIHTASGRSGPCVAVNCAAIPRDLFESELFGHVRGAFSGATIDKPGLLEQAEGGTLILDEVGEMPAEMQAKLLRVLDDGVVRRIGDVRQKHVDVKIVAATNRALEAAVAAGTFRNDLYHRLAVHSVHLKPLRDRGGDVELLARFFLRRDGLEARLALTAELLADLESRPWPGNARELRNVLVRTALQNRPAPAPAPVDTRPGTAALRVTRSTHERRAIEIALEAAGGSVGNAAQALRLHTTTLRRKMRALGIERRA